MTSGKVILFACFVVSMIGYATAATLDVGQGQTYTTIKSAVDAAKTGDTIRVNEGTYNENVLIKTSGISILGINKEKTIIDGQKASSGIRIDEVNNVAVSGFTVKNSGGGGAEAAGVTIYKGNGNTVSNMIVTGNSVGIAVYQVSNNNVISGNNIDANTGYGVYIYASNDNKVFNNNIKKNKIGAYLYNSKTNRVYSNNMLENNDQAYDNSGLNSWDSDNMGNYWSDYKGSGGYRIALGGKNATDNFPQGQPFAIKDEPISTPASAQAGGTERSTPGFTIFASVLMMAAIWSIIIKRRG